MGFKNAKQDIQDILSWFNDAFSRPSFKLFSSFIISRVPPGCQLGKEVHTSSLVQSLAPGYPKGARSLSSFTRFLGKNLWEAEELVSSSLKHFFSSLHIHSRSVLFLILDDTIARKTGKKIPHPEGARVGIKIIPRIWLMSLVINGCCRLCFIEIFSCPSGTRWVLNSITRKRPKGAVPRIKSGADQNHPG